MQYKIPQDVGIEDKIVGPLTLRQLIILAVGFGVSYVLFAILSKIYELNILEYIIIVMPALIAAAFAMIKINDIPLIKYVVLFLEFSIKPKKRVWDHRGIAALVSPDLTESTGKKVVTTTEDPIAQKAKKAVNLRELTATLDSGGFEHVVAAEHDDIDEAHDDDLVGQAYFGHKESSTENMYWRTREAHLKMLEEFAKLPVTQLKKGTKEAALAQAAVAQVKQEVEAQKKEQIAQGQTTVAAPPVKKATRKRNRPTPQPARTNNVVNTVDKNASAKYAPKAQPPTKKAPVVKKEDKQDSQFDIRELEKGEIDLNLD